MNSRARARAIARILRGMGYPARIAECQGELQQIASHFVGTGPQVAALAARVEQALSEEKEEE